MFVKIVHPGGHVELHDRPILAAEIIHRNPRCVVAHPHVFEQPWAIAKPETELMLGQKFYVVPVTTIRELQRVSKNCRSSTSTNSPVCQTPTSKSQKSGELLQDSNSYDSSVCWFFTKKKNNNTSNSCINRLDDEGASANTSTVSSTGKGVPSKDMENSSYFSDKNCFRCMRKGSPKRHAEFDQGQEQPSLASITETD